MKLKAELAGETHELKIVRAVSHVSAEVDGRLYELEIRTSNPGECLLIEDTRVYDCHISKRMDQREIFEVRLGTDDYQIRLIDLKRLRGARSSRAPDHSSAAIVAVMPGRVVRLLVDVGAHVEAGAGIVVVEAMKMQNEMKAPKAGRVVSINAEAGASVNAGDVLAVIE
jgi:biotin carboxyl carrier protein